LDSLLADHGATYEHKVISVEHVLPQTAASDSIWLTWFPDPEKRESSGRTSSRTWSSSPGRRTLKQNFDFDWKKREYFQKKGGGDIRSDVPGAQRARIGA
jgi:hypothetical protein